MLLQIKQISLSLWKTPLQVLLNPWSGSRRYPNHHTRHPHWRGHHHSHSDSRHNRHHSSLAPEGIHLRSCGDLSSSYSASLRRLATPRPPHGSSGALYSESALWGEKEARGRGRGRLRDDRVVRMIGWGRPEEKLCRGDGLKVFPPFPLRHLHFPEADRANGLNQWCSLSLRTSAQSSHYYVDISETITGCLFPSSVFQLNKSATGRNNQPDTTFRSILQW